MVRGHSFPPTGTTGTVSECVGAGDDRGDGHAGGIPIESRRCQDHVPDRVDIADVNGDGIGFGAGATRRDQSRLIALRGSTPPRTRDNNYS